MSSRISKTLKCDHNKALIDCLRVRAAEPTGVEVAGQELEESEMWSDKT